MFIILVSIILGISIFLLDFFFKKILTFYFKEIISIKRINIISTITSILVVLVPYFYYIVILPFLPTTNFEISNFKIYKSQKTSDFTEIYFSYNIKNIDRDLKNVELSSSLILKNFNNMGEDYNVGGGGLVEVFDQNDKIVNFDDIHLFRKNETYRIKGQFYFNEKELSYFENKIPFEKKINIKISGGSSDYPNQYLYKEIKHDIDLSNIEDYVLHPTKNRK
jgi:hypothetical protein